MALSNEDRKAGVLLKDVILDGKILITRMDVRRFPNGVFVTQVFGDVGSALDLLGEIARMDQEAAMRDFYGVVMYSLEHKKLPLETFSKALEKK